MVALNPFDIIGLLSERFAEKVFDSIRLASFLFQIASCSSPLQICPAFGTRVEPLYVT